MNGVQVPVVAAETGWPIRDPDSTTYVGAIEAAGKGARVFGKHPRRQTSSFIGDET
jgi:hypothetical protein